MSSAVRSRAGRLRFVHSFNQPVFFFLSCSPSCLADGLLDGVVPSDMAKTSVVSPLTISAFAFQQRSPLAVSHIPDNLASLSKLGEWNAKGNF